MCSMIAELTFHFGGSILRTDPLVMAAAPPAPVAVPATYSVRGSLKSTLRGPHYQVLLALHYMLARKGEFSARLELLGAGVWDDCVFDFQDAAGQVFERHFVQQKHHNAAGAAGWKFVCGEMELHKYFDDWFLFLSTHAPMIAKPLPMGPKTVCVFYSNHTCSADLLADLQVVQTAHQFAPIARPPLAAFIPCYRQFSAAVLHRNSAQFKMLVKCIKENSVLTHKQTCEAAKGAKLLNLTLKAGKQYFAANGVELAGKTFEDHVHTFLSQHLVLALDQPDADGFEALLCEQLKCAFPKMFSSATPSTLVQLLISDAWCWFRELDRAKVWQRQMLVEYIESQHSKIRALPEAAGASLTLLNHVLAQCAGEERIHRTELIASVTAALLPPIPGKVLNWFGAAEVGKTALLAVVLSAVRAQYPDTVLYFDSPQQFVHFAPSLRKLSVLLLCVDDVSANDAAVVAQAVPKEMQLLCLSRQQLAIVPPAHCVEILPLSDREIRRYLTSRRCMESELNFDGKARLLLSSGIPAGDDGAAQLSGLQRLMRLPKSLRAVCSAAVPQSVFPRVSVAGAYVSDDAASHVPIIPMSVRRRIPLYSCATVFSHQAFHAPKVLCDAHSTDELAVLQQLRANAEFNTTAHSRHNVALIPVSLLGLDDPAAANVKLNLSVLILQQLDKEQQSQMQSKSRQLLLVLSDPTGSATQWSREYLLTLSSLNCLLITNARYPDIQSVAEAGFVVLKPRSHAGHVMLLLAESEDRFVTLPPGDESFLSDTQRSWIEMAALVQRKAGVTLLTAEAGSGKTTALKSLHHDFHAPASQSFTAWSKEFTWCILLTFKELAALPNLTSLAELMYTHLRLAADSEFRSCVRDDLQKRRALFLLDSYDEVQSISDRDALHRILPLFRAYGCVLYSSRPTAIAMQPIQPGMVLELQRFEAEDTRRFITHFFTSAAKQHANAPDAAEWIGSCLQYLSDHAANLHSIGLPLQCYLVCEAWLPAFNAYLSAPVDARASLPELASEDDGFHLLSLFHRFLLSRFRKMVAPPLAQLSSVSQMLDAVVLIQSRPYLERLQEAAAHLLLHGVPLSVNATSVIGAAVLRTNILQDDGTFVHQTYAEYLCALYLVRQLTLHPEIGVQLVRVHRFHASFTLVFQFAAGILASSDLFIPLAAIDRVSGLRAFWSVLLEHAQDSIGAARHTIIHACLKHSRASELKPILSAKTYAHFFGTDPQEDMVDDPQADAPEEESKQEDAESPATPPEDAAAPAAAAAAVQRWQAPTLPKNSWGYGVDFAGSRQIIDSLDVSALPLSEKLLAIEWLVETAARHSSSYRIVEASASKLGEIGIANDKTVDALVMVASRVSGYGASEAMHSLVQLRASLATVLAQSAALHARYSSPLHTLSATSVIELLIPHWSASSGDWAVVQPEILAEPRVLLEQLLGATAIQLNPEPVLATIRASFPSASSVLDTVLTQLATALPDGRALFIYAHLAMQPHALQQTRIAQLFRCFEAKVQPLLQHVSMCALRGLLDTVEQLLATGAVSGAMQSMYAQSLLSAVQATINTGRYKSSIPHLVASLSRLQLDASLVHPALKALFSAAVDSGGGFWDCDAVEPSFPLLYSSWGELLAIFLVHKAYESRFPSRLWRAPEFEQFAVAAERFSPVQQEWAIWACSQCYELPTKDTVGMPLKAHLRSFGVGRFPPERVCAVLLSEAIPAIRSAHLSSSDLTSLDIWLKTRSSVAAIDIRSQMLLEFVDLAMCVITLRSQEIILHLSTKDVTLQASPLMIEQLRSDAKQRSGSDADEWTLDPLPALLQANPSRYNGWPIGDEYCASAELISANPAS